MTNSKLWATAAFGAAILVAGAAGAQDRDYFQQRADRASEGETVALRLSVPLSGDRKAVDAAPRLALSFARTDAEGSLRGMDLASWRFAGAQSGLETPYQANLGEGLGGWIAGHPYLFTVGAGLVIWGVVEATQDDSKPTNGCGQNSFQAMPVPGGAPTRVC